MRFNVMSGSLIAIALLIGACSSGSASDSGNPSTTNTAAPSDVVTPTVVQTSAEFTARAQAAATSSLLTLADFPAGWIQTPRDLNAPKLGLSGECAALETDGLPGDVAHAVSDDFIGPTKQDVTTGSSIFPDEASAQHAFEAYAATESSCRDEFTTAYAKALRDAFQGKGVAPDAVQDLTVSMTPMTSPGVGDASMSYRLLTKLTVQGQPMQFVLDAFVVRYGKVLGYVSYYTQGEPVSQEEDRFVARMAARLRIGDSATS